MDIWLVLSLNSSGQGQAQQARRDCSRLILSNALALCISAATKLPYKAVQSQATISVWSNTEVSFGNEEAISCSSESKMTSVSPAQFAKHKIQKDERDQVGEHSSCWIPS